MTQTTLMDVLLGLLGAASIVQTYAINKLRKEFTKAMSTTNTNLSALQAADAQETQTLATLQTTLTGLSTRVAATLAALLALQNGGTPVDPQQLAAVTSDLQAHAAEMLTISNALAALDPAAPATLATTTTTLTLSNTAPAAGSDLQLLVVVDETPDGAAPTGEVTFSDNGTELGTAALDITGAATFDIPAIEAGSHAFTASYAGDTANSPSNSSVVNLTV